MSLVLEHRERARLPLGARPRREGVQRAALVDAGGELGHVAVRQCHLGEPPSGERLVDGRALRGEELQAVVRKVRLLEVSVVTPLLP